MKSPPPSSVNARNTMRANRRVSGLERRLRSSLWAAGARGYRVHAKLVGRPDIVFPVERQVIFVHGCFWHGCAICALPMPKANAEFWARKRLQNALRDREVIRRLAADGWDVRVVWEHSVRENADRVARDLIDRRQARRDALLVRRSDPE